MKTTIELPDSLFVQAKVYAAEHRTSLKELVTQGLTYILQSDSTISQLETARHRERAERLIQALQANNQSPMKPLTRKEIYERR